MAGLAGLTDFALPLEALEQDAFGGGQDLLVGRAHGGDDGLAGGGGLGGSHRFVSQGGIASWEPISNRSDR